MEASGHLSDPAAVSPVDTRYKTGWTSKACLGNLTIRGNPVPDGNKPEFNPNSPHALYHSGLGISSEYFVFNHLESMFFDNVSF